MDYVDLKVGGQLIQRTEVYPFQFRYTPPASAVGSVVTLTAEAVDSAGNKSTRDLLVNVVAGEAPPASPVADRPADAARHADGRLAAGLRQRRVPERADVAEPTRGCATAPSSPAPPRRRYTLTAADLGRSVACRITATNAHGSGDATSEALIVSNPAPAFTATPQPATVAGPTTTTKRRRRSRRA